MHVLEDRCLASGHIELVGNPDHRTSQLAFLTTEGQHALLIMRARQIPWATQLGEGISDVRIQDAVALLELLRERCQQ